MEGLLQVQSELHNSINKDLINYKKSPKDRLTKEYIEVRIENLEKDWSLFRSNHTKLYEISKLEDLNKSVYVTKDLYDITKEDYLMYKSLMKSVLNKIESVVTILQPVPDNVNNKTRSNFVRLPEISIPIFSGVYSEWTTFRDLFLSLIHKNESLSNVQKMHYLKTHLSGEAEQLIRYTPITDANYSQCWCLLEKRFDNKKYQANCILKRLFGQKRMFCESSSGLKELLDTTMDCLNALRNIQVDVSTWDIIIIHIATFKLDLESRKQWELHISDIDANKLPTLDQFKSFMESRFRALEFVDNKKSTQQSSGSLAKPKVMLFTNTNVSAMRCEFCSESHKLCFCKQFTKLECEERREFVSKNRICFNCLGSNHIVYDCKKITSCKICNKRHHTLLHPENNKSVPSSGNENRDGDIPSDSDNPVVSCLSTHRIGRQGQVLLATALVQAESKACGPQTIRALIDQGSQACFITEATVQLLRLKKERVSGTISGLGGDSGLMFKHVVTIHLQSRVDKNFNIQFKAYVLKNLTSQLPERKVQTIDWVELEQLHLADPYFDTPGKIDLLLGADVFSIIIKDGVKKSPNGALIAQNTTLGWILSGKATYSDQTQRNHTISVNLAQLSEKDILKQFWEIEEHFPCMKNMLTEDEKKCEDIFNSTTKRTDEGRYIVKLPFRHSQPQCLGGDSREMAVKKFKSLERRLLKDLDLKKSYVEVINEYLQLGHMRPVKQEDQNKNKAVYLPHHAVVRNDKKTTKVRVVFNASSKNSFGISLNDTLLVGPKLQADLRHLVMRWREYPIVLVADIIKMYRQVRISEEDAIFQRIVWRENPENEIEDFELMTVTFGTASAPYLAVRALNQVSVDEGHNYPIAAPKVVQSFYMDDLMTGVRNVSEGLELYKQMKELLLKCGFELQKWNSNNKTLLSEISKFEVRNAISKQETHMQEDLKEAQALENIKEIENKGKDTQTENITKILGITWDRSEDCFRCSVNLPTMKSGPETKRSILSVIARLYDPLGWLAPSVVIAKIFIQKLWLEGKGWDEPISTELEIEWNTYRIAMPKLTSVQIPRWLGTLNTETTRELHGFCDASKSAYGAVVYLRVIDTSGNVRVSLLASKTRVAPIKQVSIPRLELCGATLLARLLSEIAEVMNIPKSNIKAWTDSMIVLAWLSSHPCRWKTFVANRVSEILSTMDSSQWFHVASKENPADCASRGVQPDALADCDLWFSGPRFLRLQNIPYNKPKDLKVELEAVVKSHFTATSEDQILERFSSLTRLLRVTAYCRRFYRRDEKNTTYLTKSELNEALICWIKKVQREDFSDDYLGLQAGENLQTKSSKLKSLCPYMDNNGIMRARGRLQKSQLPEEIKNPIILPNNSHFTKLIIADAHLKTLHGGAQLMLNYLRDLYWIVGVRNLVRQHVRKCVVCVRQNAKVQNQIMGALPSVRCTPARAFYHSGVDYAGPIKIRTTKGRGNRAYKGYICLFICMATRAIHLEVVSDMSTQAFIAAFRRFVSRRGHCSQLWSDNGTTFVGASKELKELISVQQNVAEYLESHGTEWHFIPPHAPNFGGLWEAGVKSTKFHLKRVVGESTLTFEEITTFLTQVEACLNSRPMTVDNSDLNDPRPLTPGHFLIGEPLITVPDFVNYVETNINSLTRWQHVQRMTQCFWRRWSQEYLSNLMNRYKWSSRIPEPAIGDIVLIKEDNLPPSRWLMGRIVAKHPGSDNVTRVVTIRVKSATLKRPTSKICILPIADLGQ